MLRTLLTRIESVSESSGKIASWLVLILIGAVTYDVGMRYLFSAPTVWSYETSYMLGGSLMVLGGAYTLLHQGHVRVDIIYGKLSPKSKLIIDAALTLLVFFPLMFVFLYYSIDFAWTSLVNKEVSSIGVWRPIMWPFRWVLVIAIVLFLLQGIAWFIRNVSLLITRRGYDL